MTRSARPSAEECCLAITITTWAVKMTRSLVEEENSEWSKREQPRCVVFRVPFVMRVCFYSVRSLSNVVGILVLLWAI